MRPRPRTSATPGSSRSRCAQPLAELAHARVQRRVLEDVEHRVRRGATTGPPANVEPWSPGSSTSAQPRRRRRARRSAARRRAPWRSSARRARRRRARRPTACRCARARTGSRRRSAPRRARRRPRARRAARSSASTRTPDSPWTGSSSTAAVRSSTAAAIASAVGSTATKPGHERRERRLLGLLRRRGQRAVRAPVEAAVHGRRCRRPASPCARASAPPRPPRRRSW